MSDKADIRRLARLLGHTAPEIVPSDYLARIEKDTVYATGSTTRLLGAVELTRRDSGFLVPAELADKKPLDFVGVFVTSDEYLDMPPRDTILWAMLSFEPIDLLTELAFLAHVERNASDRQTFDGQFVSSLQPKPRRRLEQLLQDGHHRILARQPLLAAMTLLLQWYARNSETERSGSEIPPRWASVILSHAVASGLGGRLHGIHDVNDPKHKPDFLVEFGQNGHFNRDDDPLSLLVRYDRLWHEYLPIHDAPDTVTAEERLVAATGLTAREHLALGFAFYAHAAGRKPDQPLRLSQKTGIGMDDDRIAAFVQSVSSALDDLSVAVSETAGDWAFLPVMKRPVVDLAEYGLLILDEGLLLDRVTKGLRRYVDDTLGGPGSPEATAWNKQVGSALESMIEDAIERLAPTELMGTGGFFFMEEDLKALYQGKVADAAICFGTDWCVFEIVGKRLSAGFLCSGNVDAFEADMEALVFKKAAQLNETAKNLLAGVAKQLAGIDEPAGRIFPCVVCSEGMPWNPLTAKYIESQLSKRGLLADKRIQPLAVLDLRDMELLELLAENGVTASEALSGWQASGLSTTPFVNYVWDRYVSRLPAPRPSSVAKRGDELMAGIGLILNLPVDKDGKFSDPASDSLHGVS